MTAVNHRRAVEAATKARSKAQDAVYAAAYPRRDIVFSECLKLASDKVRDTCRATDQRLSDAEFHAITAGKAWRDTFGALRWYRR